MTKTGEIRSKTAKAESPEPALPEFLLRQERLAAGKAVSESVPREPHAMAKRYRRRCQLTIR